MKVIQVKNPEEGGKVAFEILKKSQQTVLKHQDLRQVAVHLSFMEKSLRVTLIFQILLVLTWTNMQVLMEITHNLIVTLCRKIYSMQSLLKLAIFQKEMKILQKKKQLITMKFWPNIQQICKFQGSVATATLVLTNQARHLTAKRIWSIWINQRLKPTLASLKN